MKKEQHARKITYTFTLERIQSNLAPSVEEWGFETRVYFTRHFKRAPVTVRLKEGESKQVTVEGELPAALRGEIPPTAAVCFAATALHLNDHGIPVKVDIGTSHIMLSEIEKSFGDAARGPRPQGVFMGTTRPTGRGRSDVLPFQKDVRLQMRVVRDNVSKATIRASLVQRAVGDSLRFVPLKVGATAVIERMEEYINELYHEEMSMKNTIPGTDNIRCFLNLAEEGTQLTQVPVPAFAYVQAEVPSSNALFWKNALSNVLAREGYTCNDFLHNMNKQEQSRIAFLLMDYPITIMPYIGDAVYRRRRSAQAAINAVFGDDNNGSGKEPNDNWGVCLALLGGDCEDLALGITVVGRSLKDYLKNNNTHKGSAAAPTPTGGSKDAMSSRGAAGGSPGATGGAEWEMSLVRINEIMDQYVPLMSLCVVHGAKADDNSTMPKGAHMAVVGLPVHYFKSCLEGTEEGRTLSKQLPWPAKIDTEYETNIGEGTGMLDPRGYRDTKAHVRAYLHRGRYFNTLKHPMVQEHGAESPFFLGALQGYTRYFADRGAGDGVGAFWYTDSSRGNQRGALYTDFTNERKNVNVRPMLEPPDEVQYLIREANSFAIPPEPLVLSEQKGPLKNRDLDALQKNIEDLKRAEKQSTEVSLYVAPHQMNKKLAEGLFQDVKESLPLVWKMTYVGEHMTDQYHGFRLTFYVNA